MANEGTSRPAGFEAELWREVAQHLVLDESVRRLLHLVQRRLPLDALIVRKLEREPPHLTSVAHAGRGEQGAPEPARGDGSAASAKALLRFVAAGKAVRIPRGKGELREVLLPPGLDGAAIAGPLRVGGEAVGVVLFVSSASGGYSAEHELAAQSLLEPLSVAFENDRRLHELAQMRATLEADRDALLSKLGRKDIREAIVGAELGLRSVMERVAQVARTDAPVLLLGETGSGKEVIARAIHAQSARHAGPVVRVNCGAIAPELIDSELFGHERGAFTGAVATRKGWFERADGGTLFLDEVGELPPAAQVRLLRVLQDGSLERVGGQQSLTVSVRIVAATHRQLDLMVAEGTFREDLWYRIGVFPIRIPPLRERMQDLAALAHHFARRAGQRLGTPLLVPTEHDVGLLARYPWPGNVRELSAVLERAAILGDGRRLEVEKALGVSPPREARPPVVPGALAAAPAFTAPATPGDAATGLPPLDQAMRAHIEQALARTYGRIEGPFGAARLLGINPHTLRARMRKLGIAWARYRSAKR